VLIQLDQRHLCQQRLRCTTGRSSPRTSSPPWARRPDRPRSLRITIGKDTCEDIDRLSMSCRAWSRSCALPRCWPSAGFWTSCAQPVIRACARTKWAPGLSSIALILRTGCLFDDAGPKGLMMKSPSRSSGIAEEVVAVRAGSGVKARGWCRVRCRCRQGQVGHAEGQVVVDAHVTVAQHGRNSAPARAQFGLSN
jgi:hypothetical protein